MGRDPKASSCYARGTVPSPSEPPWGTQRCRCPLNHRHPLHPYGKKAGGAWGTGGPCLAWELAHSQSNRWWSPPLPTGHAGKYLCPDFTGRREGISFLRPPAARLPGINPFTTPGEGGREVPSWCPPCGQWSGQGVQQGSIWCRWGTVGHSSGCAHGSAVAHCGPSTVYPGNPLLDIPCAGPVGYGEWANRASPLPRFPSTAPTGSLGCSWERDGGARRALFAHGCLLTICKCKTGPEGVEICACGGVGGTQGLLTASRWHPRLCPLFPSPFVPSWAVSKRGCLLTPGLAALFVPLTFSSLYAGPFYGGFKGGSDSPLPPHCLQSPRWFPVSHCFAPTSWGCLLGTPGWPTGTAAVSPAPSSPAAWHLWLPLALVGVGANGRSPQQDSRHFAPCKQRWETQHWDPASCTALRPPRTAHPSSAIPSRKTASCLLALLEGAFWGEGHPAVLWCPPASSSHPATYQLPHFPNELFALL